jgi:3-oxoacyl-[acyl-carrier-protein] synthase II
MTGHMLGAAGAVEFVVSSFVVRDDVIPPTINYENPDPELDLDYTANASARRPVEVALSNSFGFGGHNVTLAVRKYRE